jgi:hypothetical protein
MRIEVGKSYRKKSQRERKEEEEKRDKG